MKKGQRGESEKSETMRETDLDVTTLLREQLVVRSTLDDLPFIQNVDLVGVSDRGETMGDGDGRATGRRTVQGFLDEGFRFVVEGGGGFVELRSDSSSQRIC